MSPRGASVLVADSDQPLAQETEPQRHDACGQHHRAPVQEPDQPVRLGSTPPERGEEEARREQDRRERHATSGQDALEPAEIGRVRQDLTDERGEHQHSGVGVAGSSERLLERRHLHPTADHPEHERPPVLDGHNREEQDARGRAGVFGQHQFAAHASPPASTPTDRTGTAPAFRRSRMPMTSNHSVMIVGPMMVSTREASVGSPTDAWIVPATRDRAPAPAATNPSHLGYRPESATARPNRMNVAAAKMKLNRLANAKLMVSFAWTRPSAISRFSVEVDAHSWASCRAATPSRMTRIRPITAPRTAAAYPNRARAPARPPRIEWPMATKPPSISTIPRTMSRWSGTQLSLSAMTWATPSISPIGVTGWIRLPPTPSSAPTPAPPPPILNTMRSSSERPSIENPSFSRWIAALSSMDSVTIHAGCQASPPWPSPGTEGGRDRGRDYERLSSISRRSLVVVFQLRIVMYL